MEPVFGQIKQALGFRQLLLRGLAKVQAEWNMVCTAHGPPPPRPGEGVALLALGQPNGPDAVA